MAISTSLCSNHCISSFSLAKLASSFLSNPTFQLSFLQPMAIAFRFFQRPIFMATASSFCSSLSLPGSLRQCCRPAAQAFSTASPPRRKVLLVRKPHSQRSKDALDLVHSFLCESEPNLQALVEEDVVKPESKTGIDLVIALGGDGTVLHISHLFKDMPCPPILGFNLGTIGFLLPFPPTQLQQVVKQVLGGLVGTEHRMRLNCLLPPEITQYVDPETPSRHDTLSSSGWSVMNEISLHRSQHPHMIPLNIRVQGKFLTQSVADGLILATPTGSTAYSCSAGGAIVHPNMEAMLMTPICPRSLSFRPVVLPSNLNVTLTLDPISRSTAELVLDGITVANVRPGQSIQIRRSPHPISLFTPQPNSSLNETWISDLNVMLNFNQPYQHR